MRGAFAAARLTRVAALAALSALIFEACSTTDSSSVLVPNGPASIDIAGSTAFGCSDMLAVTLTVSNWVLRPPSDCGSAAQCGTVKVSLIAPDGSPIAQQQGTNLGVVLQLTPDAFAQVLNQLPAPTLRAELIDDAGRPFVDGDGGLGSVEKPVSFKLARGRCAGELAAGGAAGAAGGGGGAGVAAEGGAGGVANAAAAAPPI